MNDKINKMIHSLMIFIDKNTDGQTRRTQGILLLLLQRTQGTQG